MAASLKALHIAVPQPRGNQRWLNPYREWSSEVKPRRSCCSWWGPTFQESNKSAPQSRDRCPTQENSRLCHLPETHTPFTTIQHPHCSTKFLLFYLNSQVIEDFGRPGIQRRHQVASSSGEEDSGNDAEEVTALTLTNRLSHHSFIFIYIYTHFTNRNMTFLKTKQNCTYPLMELNRALYSSSVWLTLLWQKSSDENPKLSAFFFF